MEQNISTPEIVIQPCSARQLANAYGVTPKVLSTWLKPYPHLCKKGRKLFTLEQLVEILERIGLPHQPLN